MPRRFQFSLKWLLAAPALCGIVAAAFMAESWWFRVLAIRLLLITAFGLTATMLFSRKQFMAAFARGAVFPAFVGAVLAVEPLFSGGSYRGDGSFNDLVLSNFDDGNMNDHAAFKFRAAFLLTATLLGGLAGVVIRLLDSKGDEK